MSGTGQTIREVDSMVEGISAAADGGTTGTGGLAQLAEVMRTG